MQTYFSRLIFHAVLILFFSPLVVGQSVSSTQDLGLRGKVKKMTEKRFTAKIEMDEVEMDEMKNKVIYQFYESGAIKSQLSSEEYSDNTTLTGFDEKGKVISRRITNSYSGTTVDTFIYTLSGKISRIERRSKDKGTEVFTYTYNESGDISEIVGKCLPKGNYSNCYNELKPGIRGKESDLIQVNALYQQTQKNKEFIDDFWESYSDNTKRGFAKYTYDVNKNWTKCTYFHVENGEVRPYMIFTREITYY